MSLYNVLTEGFALWFVVLQPLSNRVVGFTACAASQNMPPGHFGCLEANVVGGVVVKC